MRTFSVFLSTLILAVSAAAYAQNSPTIVMPSQLKWSTSGVPKGMSIAVVAGNPDKTGVYVVRIKMDAGSKYMPHTHGLTERVTVLQGTVMAGIGSKWVTSKMMALPAGAYAILPAGVPHYVMAKTDAMVQVSGQGPMTTKMLAGGNTGM